MNRRPSVLSRRDRTSCGSSVDAGPQSKRMRTSAVVGSMDTHVNQSGSSAGWSPMVDRPTVGQELEVHHTESVAERRLEKELVGTSADEESTILVEGSFGLKAFERALSKKDKESIALSYNATMKMKEYLSSWKAVERRLHRSTRDLNRAHDQVGMLKQDMSHLTAKVELGAEAHSVVSEERRKLWMELREMKIQNVQLEGKFWVAGLERARDRATSIATFMQTDEFFMLNYLAT
ncbi:hypothetical protein U1Q18_015178 [Sarracenia purpurea var. burkii]